MALCGARGGDFRSATFPRLAPPGPQVPEVRLGPNFARFLERCPLDSEFSCDHFLSFESMFFLRSSRVTDGWFSLSPPDTDHSARAGFLSGAGTGLSRSPAPRKRSATTQTTQAALRRGSCCTLCSRLRPQLRRWKAASEAPQRGRGHRWRFCYSQLELAALQEVGGDARKNDILTGRVSPKLALETTKEEGS